MCEAVQRRAGWLLCLLTKGVQLVGVGSQKKEVGGSGVWMMLSVSYVR